MTGQMTEDYNDDTCKPFKSERSPPVWLYKPEYTLQQLMMTF